MSLIELTCLPIDVIAPKVGSRLKNYSPALRPNRSFDVYDRIGQQVEPFRAPKKRLRQTCIKGTESRFQNLFISVLI